MAISAKFNQTTFTVGDTVRVHQQFTVGDKTQTQVFEGLVIGIKGRDSGKSFVVRKIATDGVGVEKIWPLISPSITKIEVKKSGNPTRSKLYFLRTRLGKEALKVKQEETQKTK